MSEAGGRSERYFRLATRRRDVTYHVAGCRHLRDKGDRPVQVTVDEVNAAIEAMGRGDYVVTFGGSRHMLHVCGACWPYRAAIDWPPSAG